MSDRAMSAPSTTDAYQPKVADALLHRMNAIQTTKTFRRIFFLTAAGLFLDAMDIYLASGTMSSFTATHFSTTAQNSVFLSLGFLGLFIGSVAAGVIGDTKGRMKAFQWNLLLFGVFTFIGAFAPNMTILIISRFISEIGLGAELVTSFPSSTNSHQSKRVVNGAPRPRLSPTSARLSQWYSV